MQFCVYNGTMNLDKRKKLCHCKNTKIGFEGKKYNNDSGYVECKEQSNSIDNEPINFIIQQSSRILQKSKNSIFKRT